MFSITGMVQERVTKRRDDWRQWQWNEVRDIFLWFRDSGDCWLQKEPGLGCFVLRYVVEVMFRYDVYISPKVRVGYLVDKPEYAYPREMATLYRQYSFLTDYDALLNVAIDAIGGRKDWIAYTLGDCIYHDGAGGTISIDGPFTFGACLTRMRNPLPGDTLPWLRFKMLHFSD